MEKFKCPKCGNTEFLLAESRFSTASIIDGKLVEIPETIDTELSYMDCCECGENVLEFINENNILKS